MAHYIDSILQPGERVLYSTTLHGIIYAPGLICIAIAFAGLFGTGSVPDPGLVTMFFGISGLFALLGGALLFRAWFRRWTTETDVTTLRVVHKEGFIQRRTFEMSLDKVESVDVDQSVFGRILRYGDVTIRGVGEGIKTIRMIGSPIEFRNQITTR